MEQEETKANKVIKVKIQNRRDEIENMDYFLPGMALIIGILLTLFGIFWMGILGFIIGIILLIIGIWLLFSKNTRIKHLKNEIKELEAEVD
jgi:membrane protein implicated in regulation of membrane protease activity